MAAVAETLDTVQSLTDSGYKWGFETDIEMDVAPKGLSEDTIRMISARKAEPEWLLAWRLKAYAHWLTLEEPDWARVGYPKIDYQDIHYYAAPKKKDGPRSLDEVDPELLKHLRQAGHSAEGAGDPGRCRWAPTCRPAGRRTPPRAAGRSRSMRYSTASRSRPRSASSLYEAGVIFCPISEAVHDHPDLVRQYLGSVVPAGDNYFAAH